MHYKRIALSIMVGSMAVIGLLLALGVAVSAQPEPAPALAVSPFDPTDAISDAWGYLKTQQLPNGAFPGWTGEADEFTTIKVVLALAADQRPVSFLTSVSGTTALNYLETQAYSYTHDVTGTLFPGRAGMLAAAVVAGDETPDNFGGMNIINELTATYHAATGAYSTTASAAGPVNQWWAIIGLAAAQETVPVTATDYLLGLQEADGGWGYGFGGDADATAHALQALLASGNVATTDVQVQAGLDFLRAQQNEQGGWNGWSGPSADSTASVIQALAAAGYTPATESWAVAPGSNPQTALAAFQAPDGSFSGNALGAAHAIAGLAEAPLPILGTEGMAHRALSWLAGQQTADGGFGGASATSEIVIAFGAAGVDAHTVQSAQGKSPVDFLVTKVPSYNADGGEMGKLILAAVASSEDPHNFGGYDLIISLTRHLSPTGQFGTHLQFRHALGILALAAAEETIPPTTTQWLKDQQLPGGGWAWATGFDADTDTTAMAIQALVAVGEPLTSTSIVSALNYLRSIQGDGAGFCCSPVWGTDSNADSTALAIQALLAAGQDLDDWAKNGRTPLDALRRFQKSDGPLVYQWGGWGGPVDNAMSTYHAVPALMGQAHPIAPQVLETFAPVYQGSDPDQTVATPIRATWGDSVDVVIPFGSDLDEDGGVDLAWRKAGATSWNAVDGGDIHRVDGYYTATLPLTQPVSYEFQVTFEDSDGVQFGSQISGTAQMPPVELEPHMIYLPLVIRNS
jgi:prenyltransferase beta subunit